MEIAIHMIGLFGILASIVSFQCKKHNLILAFRTCNELMFSIQYLLLGAYTGTIVNLVGCLRNIIFAKLISRNKRPVVYILIFCVVFTVLGLLSWQGYKSILVITAKILSTIAYGNKNTTIVRTVIFITSTAWLIYNYTVSSYEGVLCETLTLLSLVFGIIRFDIVPVLTNKKDNKYPSP